VAGVVNINDVLDGHVTLDLECLDRVYLNAYVPNLQVGGQVVTFLGSGADNGAPRGAVVADGGEKPSSPCRRSGGVKLEAA